MNFSTDNHFVIGHRHLLQGKPCQDYAFSSVYGQVGFGVVSDGCSNGRRTDIGSRIIALSAAAVIKQYANLSPDTLADRYGVKNAVRGYQEQIAKLTREALGLDFEDMLATCGYACLNPIGGFVHLRGDGAIAVIGKNGDMKLISCQWDKNTPFYPAYADDNYKSFIDFHGGNLLSPVLKFECWERSASTGMAIKKEENLVSVADGIEGIFYEFSPEEVGSISCVAIFTDGVMQIGNMNCGNDDFVDWKEVVLQLTAFKSHTGEFAKRRLIRFLKDQQKEGKIPVDDIAYAVVRICAEDEV